ncbi:hypothetical protein D3C78_1879960 [compost metagenome]
MQSGHAENPVGALGDDDDAVIREALQPLACLFRGGERLAQRARADARLAHQRRDRFEIDDAGRADVDI